VNFSSLNFLKKLNFLLNYLINTVRSCFFRSNWLDWKAAGEEARGRPVANDKEGAEDDEFRGICEFHQEVPCGRSHTRLRLGFSLET